MRITNQMIFGTSVNNMHRNARHINNLVQSIETTKRIQRPSDDPIIASRALRYRGFLAETNQFMTNASSAMSWMEVTESALQNILTGNDSIMNRINQRLIQTAHGTLEFTDVQAVIAELQELFGQLTSDEMNQTYMGRYVFSGFHTDQPPILVSDITNRPFVVEQTFRFRDIEETIAFHRPGPTYDHDRINVNLLKLPFNNVNLQHQHYVTGVPDIGIFQADGVTPLTPNVVFFDSHTDPDAYRPPETTPPTLHFIRSTGELVIPDNGKSLFENGVVLRYCNQNFEYDAGTYVATDEPNPFRAGELNPMVNFRSWELFPNWQSVNPPAPPPTPGSPMPPAGADVPFREFNTINDTMRLEVSPNSHITLNTHARDVVTPQLFADFKRLFEFIDSFEPTNPWEVQAYFEGEPHNLSGTSLTAAVYDFNTSERGAFRDMVYSRFNNLIRFQDDHSNMAQRQLTNLGTRMNRLEMIQIRLEENEVAYTALLSEAEDTDIPAAIIRRNGAEAAFRDALRAIAMVTQQSLADFISR